MKRNNVEMNIFKLIIVIVVFSTVSHQQKLNYDVLEKFLGLHRANEKIYNKFLKRVNLNEDIQQPGVQDETYDFIIVGSGSAGSVLANRLTEISDWKVLLLEAGRVENAVSLVPVVAPVLQFTDYDWHYLMEYQEGIATAMVDQRMAWPRGKALGGTTVINYMIYTRGNPLDFDKWAAAGNPGWSYAEVLPYFLKSENATTLQDGNPRYHNSDGEWSVTNSYRSPLLDAFLEAGEELGYQTVDYTSPNQIGFSTVKANEVNGKRHSVATAFLSSIKHRKNLHIRTSAFVEKILINPENKQAHGVEYTLKGHRRRAYAAKEVILSAGTFNSPQLLMLSGIGPGHHLNELGVGIVQDLPVGEYMQDHIAHVGLTFTVDKNVSLNFHTVLSTQSVRDYLEYGKGPITSLGGVEGIAYIQAFNNSIANYPDTELIFVGTALNGDYGLVSRRSMRIRDDVYEALWRQLHDVHTWTIFPMLLHPKSVGSMKLRSKNPRDPPLLYGNFFTDPQNQDLMTLVAAVRFILELSKTVAFQKFNTKFHDVPVPGCEQYPFNSDEYWGCAIKALSITLHHQVGTCKMGPNHDKTAVVDPKLRVYGVRGLRVADCSVIPFAVTAHTSAPCVMVGEKAADIIKEYWSRF